MIKFAFYFCLSFLILSVPIKQKEVFHHLNKLTKPYTHKIYQFIGAWGDNIFTETAQVGKKLFKNSRPKSDQVRVRQSSTMEDVKKHENYTDEEKDLLKRVLEGAE